MLLIDSNLNLLFGKRTLLVLQVGASLSNLSLLPLQIMSCNPNSYQFPSRAKLTELIEIFFGVIQTVTVNRTWLTGRKFVLLRIGADLGCVPLDPQTWPCWESWFWCDLNQIRFILKSTNQYLSSSFVEETNRRSLGCTGENPSTGLQTHQQVLQTQVKTHQQVYKPIDRFYKPIDRFVQNNSNSIRKGSRWN